MMVHQTKTGIQVLQHKYEEDIIYLSTYTALKNPTFLTKLFYILANYCIPIIGKHLLGLASAASGYQKIFEENRKLYNQLQDMKGKIQVVRV